ncbi:hypothetical protein B0T10DRAFT_587620 [Thelonectria olida]|uniref:RBR-type E3 ubiquitin transferase n=1 Tax=Thelonectria olida TaxID=1576542 RepID=A0A9P8WB83_9HYPO|nr:hypothetical protein B0T10DRAFT_587620 [Thelonectria olida]
MSVEDLEINDDIEEEDESIAPIYPAPTARYNSNATTTTFPIFSVLFLLPCCHRQSDVRVTSTSKPNFKLRNSDLRQIPSSDNFVLLVQPKLKMEMFNLDDPSVSLMIQLHLEELQQLGNSSKGKGREGEQSDSDVAAQIYKAELEYFKSVVSDRSMCKSIAQAVISDGALVNQLRREDQEEAQGAGDQEMAMNLGNSESGDTSATEADNLAPDEMPIPDGELERLSKLEALYMCSPHEHLPDQGESSSWAASRPGTSPPVLMATCVCCGDDYRFYDVARCPCSHEYCRNCLAELFRNSMTDESLYPPRCCRQQIPLDPNRPFLPSYLVGEFLAKKAELDETNRTYCHEPTCSTFIPTQTIKGDVGLCSKCSKQTCAICKGASHQGDCPQDHATQELLRLATENGWQRCRSCARVVELGTGCNHITCWCGAEFCYICNVNWKECQCVVWDEARLLERAEAIVDRNLDGRPQNPARRARDVERERRNLVENHECDHDHWKWRPGPRRCEECRNYLQRPVTVSRANVFVGERSLRCIPVQEGFSTPTTSNFQRNSKDSSFHEVQYVADPLLGGSRLSSKPFWYEESFYKQVNKPNADVVVMVGVTNGDFVSLQTLMRGTPQGCAQDHRLRGTKNGEKREQSWVRCFPIRCGEDRND